MPAPASEMPPASESLVCQTSLPVSAWGATTVPRLVPVKTHPSATTGVDWITPASGIASFQARASLETFAVVSVRSAVWSRWLSTVPPYVGQSPPGAGLAQPGTAAACAVPPLTARMEAAISAARRIACMAGSNARTRRFWRLGAGGRSGGPGALERLEQRATQGVD